MKHPASVRRAYVALGVGADPVLQQGVGSGGASNAPGGQTSQTSFQQTVDVTQATI